MMTITRFPPSPTGYLHIGSVRTALYAWLYARQQGGKMVLRIEDTDTARSTQEAVDIILEGMQWLGLDWDEGPYYQTARVARYQAVIQQLIESGHAYRCSCTTARLDALRQSQQAQKQKPKYDGHCRDKDVSPDTPHVVRFKTPQDGQITLHDVVKGDITVHNSELDDLILQRTDGMPTYQLSVVVDDWDMGITHVIRGDDHVNNTHRQMHIFNALNAPLPTFAHLPMILGSDGKRFSKRHGAVSVLAYRDEGILPQALLNYLVRLGWSHGDQEIFSVDEMVQHFDLTHIQHSPAAFDMDKLHWLNQHYIKTLPESEVCPVVQAQLADCGVEVALPKLQPVFSLLKERYKTLKDMAQGAVYFFQAPTSYDEKAQAKFFDAAGQVVLRHLITGFEGLSSWSAEDIQGVLHGICEEHELKFKKVAQPLRLAVTGGTISPPMAETLALLGQAETLARLQKCLA